MKITVRIQCTDKGSSSEGGYSYNSAEGLTPEQILETVLEELIPEVRRTVLSATHQAQHQPD